MKKSSIFILVITFIVSIFVISFFGLQVRDEHMKRYFTRAEFINTEVIDMPDGSKIKYVNVTINEEDGMGYFYITYGQYYIVAPEDSTDSDGYEFIITSEVPTFTDSQGKEQAYAEIYKEKVTFYHECAVNVMLRTTDGSGLSDTLLIVCDAPTGV